MLAGAGLLALGEGGLTAARWALGAAAAAAPPPETARLRLLQPGTSLCVAPIFLAQEFLPGEGFREVQYVRVSGAREIIPALVSGKVDMAFHFAAPLAMGLDAGAPLVLLAGVHAGCFELFGTAKVRSIRDLKGKTVGVPELGVGPHTILSTMLAYVGIDPRKEITWAVHPPAESMRLLADGRIDAYLGFPPDPQELRARKIGHVVVNSAVDRPWSQYFCCLVAANREFVRNNPQATKRALRAILKAADFSAREPARVARFLVDKGYAQRYDYALDVLTMLPYGNWRDHDPEDSLRFWALRLHEAGMIRSSPQKIIAQGTDWRFLNEIRRELKEKSSLPGSPVHHHGG